MRHPRCFAASCEPSPTKSNLAMACLGTSIKTAHSMFASRQALGNHLPESQYEGKALLFKMVTKQIFVFIGLTLCACQRQALRRFSASRERGQQ
jgi:hypothetical protein